MFGGRAVGHTIVAGSDYCIINAVSSNVCTLSGGKGLV